MKKLVKCTIVCGICIMNLIFIVGATDSLGEIQNQIIQDESLDNLITGQSDEILGDIKIDPGIDLIKESVGIIERSKEYFENAVKDVTKTMIKITIIIIISSCFTGFVLSNEIKDIDNYINMATVISISIIVLVDVKSVLTICAGTIDEIDILSKGLMPTMVTAITISGAPTTGTITYAISMFAFDIVITLINRVLFPFIYVYIAIITVNSAIGNDILIKVADFIKWISLGSLKIILTLFITYISLSGVISGSVDAFAIKTTKFAVSSAIPVVGSIISDATETILVGASIIKNAIGIFGILAMVSICIIPITRIFVNFLMFKITAVLVSPISTKQVSNLLEGMSTAFNMALAMISACFLIFFVMLVASIVLVRGI